MHTNRYTRVHAYTYIHACLYTYIHTHIHAHTCNMYICTHANTPGTTALQRLREELMQMPELPLSIQIEGVMLTATCWDTGLDSSMTTQVRDRRYSLPVDGLARNPGLPSLLECISRSYGQAQWLYELPGMATDPELDEWADGVKTIRIPRHLGIGVGTSR